MKFLLTAVSTVVALFTMSGSCRAKTSELNMDKDRLVEVIGIVDSSIFSAAQRLDTLSKKSDKDIYIFVNSPGGEVDPGMNFIDAMQQAKHRGVKLICATGVLAASMAFNIMAYCDERYALSSAHLLFHPMRIGSSRGFTRDELDYAKNQMTEVEEEIKDKLVDSMGHPLRPWFEYHYAHETLWLAKQLNKALPQAWTTVVDDITGTENLYVYQRASMFFLGRATQGDGYAIPNPFTSPLIPKLYNAAPEK